MSELIVFDTSVLVDHLRTGRYAHQFASVRGLVRNCSVVLAELWRGATAKPERGFLETLQRNHPLITPTAATWIESGQLLARIRHAKGFEPAKLRDLHFDVLIALTARAHGARLITSNAADFELIRQVRTFDLEIW